MSKKIALRFQTLGGLNGQKVTTVCYFMNWLHSTGSERRLGRSGIIEPTRFGTEEYSKEELIAEMGAGYLGGMTGILDEDLISNHAAYIQNWISILQEDKNILIEAASKAQKAVDYILMECPF
jgi:Antirestriction protein